MTTPKNPAASVKGRLLNMAHAQAADFQQLLLRYVMERWLFRIEQSPYRERFVLKGAMLFHIWLGQQALRVTKDLDLLSFGESNPESLKEIFADICQLALEKSDGIVFEHHQIQAGRIKEGQKYEGVRLTIPAYLEKTRLVLQIDVGFGDAITPAPVWQQFPVILEGLPAPVMLTYPKETVVAEKFHAMVVLGIQNTRMKDFYDLYTLAQNTSFEGESLCQALKATFERRDTVIPTVLPIAFTPAFTQETLKIQQWKAFCRRLKKELSLAEVMAELESFLIPPSHALIHQAEFQVQWQPGQGWIR